MNSKSKRIIKEFFRYLIIIFAAFWMVLPFFWMVSSSLMTPQEITSIPPKWIPEKPQWHNYIDVLKRVPIGKYYLNSLLVAGTATIGVILTSSLAGYAFAKLHFPGKKPVFQFILVTMMFPVFIFLIPNFFLMKTFGMLTNHLSLIVPFLVSGYGIFLLRQFIMSIPDELLDSARIDGASEFKIYRSIILPNIKPGLSALAITTFIGQWNNFLWPMIISSFSPNLMTVPVGIQRLALAFASAETQHLVLTGLVYQVVPMLIVFVYFQKNFIKGFVVSGFGNI
ncbi:MAG TPA: carbohydrate ABC transporter permease [Defluviitoga tunisiensis]|nr:carbohydrate ABC transporter permease [Defluviitoga tunisiensis]HOP25406.1 carbohydrate ABC transporter permease [Defluviitoga sp.]HOL86724.1 carbohydrate ABC transporter permease [Defluviitoga tunisiensis]HPP10488.1 carbohydrate ABC transporter permease [Defluviitoga tunisiensis]HPZ66911.1 carbohydrate ABC transporter permease [Defluviitoga tunisiensis]